jgi:hypothetical protein
MAALAATPVMSRTDDLVPTPLTRNQIALMRRDNVASRNLPGLPELAIDATAIETIVPAVERRSEKAQRR